MPIRYVGLIMMYSLWNTVSGDIIGDYDSEAAALAAVRDAADLNGDGSVETYSLVVSDHGKTMGIADGSNLLHRARHRVQPATAS
jgi:hypothetical protein